MQYDDTAACHAPCALQSTGTPAVAALHCPHHVAVLAPTQTPIMTAPPQAAPEDQAPRSSMDSDRSRRSDVFEFESAATRRSGSFDGRQSAGAVVAGRRKAASLDLLHAPSSSSLQQPGSRPAVTVGGTGRRATGGSLDLVAAASSSSSTLQFDSSAASSGKGRRVAGGSLDLPLGTYGGGGGHHQSSSNNSSRGGGMHTTAAGKMMMLDETMALQAPESSFGKVGQQQLAGGQWQAEVLGSQDSKRPSHASAAAAAAIAAFKKLQLQQQQQQGSATAADVVYVEGNPGGGPLPGMGRYALRPVS